MMNPSRRNKKDVNFELNLLPVFDVLSACTCFLLMTAVWIHLGSMDVTQALGGQSVAESKNPPSVWVTMNKNGQVIMTLKDAKNAPPAYREVTVSGANGDISWKQVGQYVQGLQKKLPDVKTALIMPHDATKYDDLVRIMDQFRGGGVQNIGISPL
jgi:biopolymer transport protein TolR